MRWGVGPVEDEFGAREDGADGFTLDADSFAVNDSHGLEAFFTRQAQVLFDDCFNVARRNRVEIEDVRDFDLDRLWKWIVRIHVVHDSIVVITP